MSLRADQALTNWLKKRGDRWLALNSELTKQLDNAGQPLESVRYLIQGFRSLARDVSLARSMMPGSKLTLQLESLFLQVHEAVYRPPHHIWHQFLALMREDTPLVVRALCGPILATVLLFVLSVMAGWLLVFHYPELGSLFASEKMINGLHRGELWTDGLLNIVPSSLLSLSIMTNNIVVSLFAFACGALYGLGTLYLIGINGLMLGGVFALTAQYGLEGKLFSFVVAHGVVELSVICLAGAAGVRLGEALAQPGNRSRADAFQSAVTEAGKLLPVVVLFLIGAGLIEGYISPDDSYPLSSRLAIGLGYGFFLWLTLTGRIFSAGHRKQP